MALVKCKECDKEISDKAHSCPNCGAPKAVASAPKSDGASGKIIGFVFGAVLLLVVAATCGRSNQSNEQATQPPQKNLATMVNPATNEGMATLINMNGCLCAEVLSVRQISETRYRVQCTEYRNGTGEIEYIVDLSTGKATRKY